MNIFCCCFSVWRILKKQTAARLLVEQKSLMLCLPTLRKKLHTNAGKIALRFHESSWRAMCIFLKSTPGWLSGMALLFYCQMGKWQKYSFSFGAKGLEIHTWCIKKWSQIKENPSSTMMSDVMCCEFSRKGNIGNIFITF